MPSIPVTVVIPTYRREDVLLETIQQILNLSDKASQVLVVDQTPSHKSAVEEQLAQWGNLGEIEWVRKEEPSIPAAMNTGLLVAKCDIVLFLDDDIEISSNLIRAHWVEYQDPEVSAVVGQVVQSWEDGVQINEADPEELLSRDPDDFRFNSNHRCKVERVMAGNLSVRRDVAISVGGFDENFVKVAYRFEAEFSDRMVSTGHTIIFQPAASLTHLKVNEGGTRSYGEHLKTIAPSHAVGRYYYYLVARGVSNRWCKFLCGPVLAIKTKFHLSHPWWMPASFIAEVGGMFWAIFLYMHGRKLIGTRTAKNG